MQTSIKDRKKTFLKLAVCCFQMSHDVKQDFADKLSV